MKRTKKYMKFKLMAFGWGKWAILDPKLQCVLRTLGLLLKIIL